MKQKNNNNLQNTCKYTTLFYNSATIGQQKAENKVGINKHTPHSMILPLPNYKDVFPTA